MGKIKKDDDEQCVTCFNMREIPDYHFKKKGEMIEMKSILRQNEPFAMRFLFLSRK